MTTFQEGELEFTFGNAWRAEQFDRPGVGWPKGVMPVDFIAEGRDEIVLLEVKDPSASGATSTEQQRFAPPCLAVRQLHGGIRAADHGRPHHRGGMP